MFPVVALEVSVTLSPVQKVELPVMEIAGVEGIGFTTIAVGNEVALHPLTSVAVTKKLPLAFTLMLCVVSLLLHKLPAAALEVRSTLSPLQNVIGPFGVILGTGGKGFTVIKTGNEVDLHPLEPTLLTVKLPEVFTTILWVVSLVLHKFNVEKLEVSVTLSPWQKVLGPVIEIVAVGGGKLTVILNTEELREVHPKLLVTLTLNAPAVFTTMLFVVSPLLQVLPLFALEVSVKLSP